MAMVIRVENLALDDVLQPLQIHNKTGDWVRLTGDGDLQRVAVPVAVAPGTLPNTCSFVSLDQASFQ